MCVYLLCTRKFPIVTEKQRSSHKGNFISEWQCTVSAEAENSDASNSELQGIVDQTDIVQILQIVH